VDINNGPAQAILDVVSKILIGHEFGWFGATSPAITVPLRHRRSILQPICPGGGVATELSRNRRRGSIQPASERSDAHALGVQNCNLPLDWRKYLMFDQSIE
jgi:hypothetical protein